MPNPSRRRSFRGARSPRRLPTPPKTKLAHTVSLLGRILLPRPRFFRPPQQKLDAAFDVGVLVAFEMQFGDMPELEPSRELAAQVAAGMFERCKCLILSPFVAAEINLDGGVAGIGADMDFGDVDPDQAGIVELETDQLRELLADGFGDPSCTSFVHRRLFHPLHAGLDQRSAEDRSGFIFNT